ncbi:unnamed protein product [Toxocara canis]|uniref:Ricin B-type lectin domain-containing protein n=1 Tax=Toxocara canis TaxID=6265 RepID=A0A183UH06_TOXCA|nr:unnamed protein product [Toxocara canis]
MNVSSAFYPFAKFDGSSSSASNYVWLNNGFSNEVAVGQFAARNFLGDHSQESDYGILVLNGGTGELVQWELVDVEGGVTMLADANASMTALSTIIPITNSLHLYLFDACEYSGLSSSVS